MEGSLRPLYLKSICFCATKLISSCIHSNAITSPYIGSSEYFYNYFKTLCEFAQALSMLRVHSAVQLLGSGAVCRATVAALGSLQFLFSAETSKIPLERVIVESQHSSCCFYTTTLPLLKVTLVSAFDAVTRADLSIFSSMAAETFSWVLKKGLTCATFGNCQGPGVMLAAHPCSDFIRKRMCPGIQILYFLC